MYEKVLYAQAKQHLLDDPNYTKKKLQFDHVWPILKDAEKWTDNGRSSTKPRQKNYSSEGYESTSRTSQSSGTLPFDIDLNADEDEQELFSDELASPHRPIGVKKANLKRKELNEKSKIAQQVKESNQELKELLEKSLLERNVFSSKHEEYASQTFAIQRQREESKIMLTSLDSITDPEGREYLRMKKNEIMERRARESQLQQSPATFGYGNFGYGQHYGGGSGGYGQHYGGTAGYGEIPHYGGSGGSGTSGAHAGVQQFGGSSGSNTHGGYGGMPEHGGSNDSLPEY
ncbi:keratin, type I cytoskeletal 9 isoform X1 [Rosa chinensis]|uniref:keratin, type I cytoskeletal 9 isoform X1 n=1 Tax=Rosa chinensis TaxID=74649 RepID=UPI001AD93996|nr:keratin, type I cytoskeletal 9 isoform X1 [Rosa chinensis]